MGIRVHKFLGYGLTDVRTVDGRLSDPRINADSPLLEYERDSLVNYEAWLKETYPSDVEDIESFQRLPVLDMWYLRDREGHERPRRSLSDTFTYDPEYGLPNVIVFQPLGTSDWHRYDDSIDWVEETYLREGGQINHVEVLPHGIYPFSGYMDARTGERLPEDVMTWIRAVSRLKEDPTALPRPAMDALAQAAGFSDHADATTNVAPVVPDEIKALTRYGKVFTNDNVWRELRPMLYTYWS